MMFVGIRFRVGIPTNVIYEDIAKPLLGIQNLQKDKRIAYHHYENPSHKIEEDVDKGKYILGIQHYPITFSDIVATVEDFDLLPQRAHISNPNLYTGCLSLTFYHNDQRQSFYPSAINTRFCYSRRSFKNQTYCQSSGGL